MFHVSQSNVWHYERTEIMLRFFQKLNWPALITLKAFLVKILFKQAVRWGWIYRFGIFSVSVEITQKRSGMDFYYGNFSKLFANLSTQPYALTRKRSKKLFGGHDFAQVYCHFSFVWLLCLFVKLWCWKQIKLTITATVYLRNAAKYSVKLNKEFVRSKENRSSIHVLTKRRACKDNAHCIDQDLPM